MDISRIDPTTNFEIPLFATAVQAGFPSPADDYIENAIDLNKQLIDHPNSTFFVRVKGDSMIDANISEGDVLIVDRSIEPKSGSIVIAVTEGELTVKRMIKTRNKLSPVPENATYPAFEITSEDFRVWGVVTYIIHKAK